MRTIAVDIRSRETPVWSTCWLALLVIALLVQTAHPGRAAGQTAEAQQPYTADLIQARVTVEDLGNRLVTPEVLRSGTTYRDLGALLANQRIVGLRVHRDPGNAHGGEVPLCLMLRAYREGDPSTGCMPFRIDGRDAPQAQVVGFPPDRMYAVVVLEGREARRLLGAEGRPGAVLIYTGR